MNNAATPLQGGRPSGSVRAALISWNIALHFALHDIVTALNAARPTSAFHDLSLPVDAWIPYLAWTWTVYYFGDLYIIVWGAIVVWGLPARQFYRAIAAYSTLIIIGAAFHLLLPGRSPWPDDGSVVQQWFHTQITNDRNVCLPSMHVALALLPSCMTFDLFRSRIWGTIATIVAILISISTVTLKEHYFLDVITGAGLALAVYAFWKWPLGRSAGHSGGVGHS